MLKKGDPAERRNLKLVIGTFCFAAVSNGVFGWLNSEPIDYWFAGLFTAIAIALFWRLRHPKDASQEKGGVMKSGVHPRAQKIFVTVFWVFLIVDLFLGWYCNQPRLFWIGAGWVISCSYFMIKIIQGADKEKKSATMASSRR